MDRFLQSIRIPENLLDGLEDMTDDPELHAEIAELKKMIEDRNKEGPSHRKLFNRPPNKVRRLSESFRFNFPPGYGSPNQAASRIQESLGENVTDDSSATIACSRIEESTPSENVTDDSSTTLVRRSERDRKYPVRYVQAYEVDHNTAKKLKKKKKRK